ncbi:MAG TPA: glycine cleavage system aminomethyltransferase GcvT [Chthonomonadaceae bacterium]|nr:glycine cleavage system aminomethyltransferase GcvT [Chthonomonadaceae bacterium]
MTDTSLKHTPLYDAHIAAGARIVDFAGWAMPVLYTGILEETRAVRTDAGMFDISHMGRLRVAGPGATTLLQTLTSNDVAALAPSRAQYSLLTNPQGGIIDDIIVYRESAQAYLVVVNASNTDKDLNWIYSHTPADVAIENRTDETAMIAVQGPNAPARVGQVVGNRGLLSLDRFQYATGSIAGAEATFCRTGYTGEDGFEIIVPAGAAPGVWQALREAGVAPCGLGARDALRIEAGYPLYGHEIDDTTSPVEAGLMWVVKLDKGDFTGRDAIQAVKEQGPKRRLIGLTLRERIVPRQGYTIYVGPEAVGEITSGVFSPTRNHSIAMGYVATPYARPGTEVEIAIRDKRAAATVVPKKALLES